MQIITSKQRDSHLSVFGVLTISLLVAFVLLVVIVAVFGMDDMMDVMHRMMTRIGM
ncbi:hypothetical protein HN018_04045 [Lichenicola cladoniae]|uniref:Uncharacterized protein n=1 Tax=Lichenicola cladoniae TaxID=1484109 RepID=A0A6M8HLV1_9PROT|nr:hypothetical protein [Lichenicola cladoniae]NPD69889.1 hypothetical protein [Acetobacteraceae bacterium]QKE89312.1 hypothetical protein HN018_04045 [Lichenicola cladoniae]